MDIEGKWQNQIRPETLQFGIPRIPFQTGFIDVSANAISFS
jgi:hypothetical protein